MNLFTRGKKVAQLINNIAYELNIDDRGVYKNQIRFKKSGLVKVYKFLVEGMDKGEVREKDFESDKTVHELVKKIAGELDIDKENYDERKGYFSKLALYDICDEVEK